MSKKIAKKSRLSFFIISVTFIVSILLFISMDGNTTSSAIGNKPSKIPAAYHDAKTKQYKCPKGALIPGSFTALAEKAGPAVVNIRTEKTIKSGGVYRHFFGTPRGNDPFDEFFKKFFEGMGPREYKQKSLGSGFIIDPDGYIVTNNHVIEGADDIQVKLQNGKEYDAKIIGSDPNTDLALIKIDADEELPHLPLGDSDAIEVGEWVVAIGNPFGLDHTVTAGIISAKGRVIGAGPYDDFLQTDASINPGNSGGPLINMEGEVVGINTAIIAGGTGIGFAIPSSMAKGIIKQLKEKGEVTRGWLGVSIQDLDNEMKDYYGVDSGVLVVEVFPGDPADKAGIKPNDIIISVNGDPVSSSRELSRKIAAIPPGKKARIEVIRGKKHKVFKVKLAKRSQDLIAAKGQPYGEKPEDSLGLKVTEITPEIAKRYDLSGVKGIMITSVAPDSKAFKAGFKQGDVIEEINHEPVTSIDDYEKIIKDADKGDTLFFKIRRPYEGIKIIKLVK